MKFLLLSLALVAVVFSQSSDDCDLRFRSWADYRTLNTAGSEWEDYEIIQWGMDGGNKWHDWWMRPFSGLTGTSRYSTAVCSLTSQGDIPTRIPATCGSCPITGFSCECYPYYDIANNYQDWPGNPVRPGSGSIATISGNPYKVGTPPFENGTGLVGDLDDSTADNCKQYRPQFVYFYSRKMQMGFNGEWEANEGISRGFTPSVEAWSDFCDALYSDSSVCHAPNPRGGSDAGALWGSHFSFASGTFTLLENNEVNYYTDRSYSGCHQKQHDRRFPSGVYCGDASAWTYGAGATAHVRFGCDRETFFATDTDVVGDIDDSDCDSVYVMFDEMNPLVSLVENYDSQGLAPNLLQPTFQGTGCWRDTSYRRYVTDMPNYRTPCSASGLTVPLLVVMCTLLMMVVRNF